MDVRENFSFGWPSCGEIDIMEMVGGNGWNDMNSPWNSPLGECTMVMHLIWKVITPSVLASWLTNFIVFLTYSWTPSSLKWLRDDIQYPYY